MKLFTVTLGLIALLLAPNHSHANENQGREVMIGISDAFIPSGFDSDSDSFVVVSGVFQNGCYRWSKADVTSTSPTTHEVKSYATVESGLCIMVLVPFTKEVHLGKLQPGNHNIRFILGEGNYFDKKMTIE